MKVNKKHNIALWIAAVLFCLVLISTSMNSGIYARFRSLARGNDRARVASFSVTADMKTDDQDPACRLISFSNTSEVPVACSIVISFAEEVPEDLIQTVKLGDTEKSYAPDTREVKFEVGSLAAGASMEPLKLSFGFNASAGSSEDPDFDNETVKDNSGSISFTVTVEFSQIN